MRYKALIVVALLFIYASSCKTDETEPYEPYDHAAQEIIDRDSLQKYMQTHFVDPDGLLQEITGSETPLINQVETINVPFTHLAGTEFAVEVDYELYYYETEEGIGDSPTQVDMANTSYKGMLLDHEVFDQNDYGTWFHLNNVTLRAGWKYGLPHFKSGTISGTNDDGTNIYTGGGKGILLMPSGLGYAEIATSSIPRNSPLIFYIELNQTFHTDYDEDGILSMYEDIDLDGDFSDDTDDDSRINYLDADDDGDGTLTKYENPDPNGDGNPEDAQDSDGDGTPDYLDSDTL